MRVAGNFSWKIWLEKLENGKGKSNDDNRKTNKGLPRFSR